MSGPNPDQMIPVQLFEPQQLIYVSRFADLAEKDIDSVEFLPNGSVLVQFDDIGRGRLDALTRAGIGSVLVVFCNGRVVYAPQIDVAVTNGRLIIPSGIAPEEVKALQEQIRRRKK
jgi:preprotein translocase subunit SecD